VRIIKVFALVCTLFLTGCEQETLQEIHIGEQSFLMEIADSPEEWSRGLMFREKLELSTACYLYSAKKKFIPSG
jgi:hypothetical protein